MVLQGVQGFRDDYLSHVESGRCLFGWDHPVPCVALCPAGVGYSGYIAPRACRPLPMTPCA